MTKTYAKFLLIIFVLLLIGSIYTYDKNAILWSSLTIMFLISNYFLDIKNNSLKKYELLLFLISTIILFLNTFTDIIKDIPLLAIIVIDILYIIMIFRKIRFMKSNE